MAPLKDRTIARGVALQILYEMDLSTHHAKDIIMDRFESVDLDDSQKEFVINIIKGVAPIREELDSFIGKFAPEWPIDQIAVVDRNIIRIAVWEFAISETTHVRVAINEAVELAKKFGADSSQRFVNGVLGSLAEHKNEIKQAVEAL